MPEPTDLDVLREAYVSRFGPIASTRDVYDDQGQRIVFQILALGDAVGDHGARVVYASLGASRSTAGYDVIFTAAVPFEQFKDAVDELAESTSPLAPFLVVPHEIQGTFYTALLLVPAAEGEQVLGRMDGPLVDVLLALPITEAEQRLAADDPRQVLGRLRAAEALRAVPFRECLVAPAVTQAFRFQLEQELLSATGRRFQTSLDRLDRLEELGAPEEIVGRERRLVAGRRALLHYLDSGDGAPPPEHDARVARHVPFALHRATPPTGARIARRALVLAALAQRSRIERDAAQDAEPRRQELLAWMDALDLASEREALETELLEQPFGLLASRHVDGLSWLTEGLVVLAWALGRAELPRHDERASFRVLASALGLQRDEASSLLASSDVRSEAELQRFLGRAYAVSWRLFQFYGDRKPLDLARLGREERFWFGRLGLDDVPLADGDLVIDGAPLHIASREALHRLENIALQRLRAATWVCGVHSVFSQAPGLP